MRRKPPQRIKPHQAEIDFRDELIVDNFAGGGGASLGIEWAFGRPVDVAINHDAVAIAMHKANHPDTEHYCENVWDVDPREVAQGRPVGLAWFSPDCKHFSKAKGGKPVEKNIRGLAWVVIRWAAAVRPRVIMLENVEEFQAWGPLTKDNMPCPMRKGHTFRRWKQRLEALGYQIEHRELRACDYGAPTIRKRLFVVARCDGKPIVWPEPTHGPNLLPYRTAAECIDFSIPCPSIFERKRPLAENTMKRIYRGIQRFVIDAEEPFIVTCNHGGDWFRGQSVNEPMKTITAARDAHGLVVPYLTEHANGSKQRIFAVDEPLRTQCAEVKGGHFAAVEPILEHVEFSCNCGHVTDKAAASFIIKRFGGAVGADARVTAHLTRPFGQSVGQKPDEPAPTVMPGGLGKTQLCTSHLIKLKGTCRHGRPVQAPMPTVQAGGLHIGEVRAFLVKYYGTAVGQNLKDPLHTVTAKHRMGLVTVAGEEYQIADIGMRMLSPRELFRAQGFPDDYIIDLEHNGRPLTKTAQVRLCGNSVCPHVARALLEANLEASNAENGTRRASA